MGCGLKKDALLPLKLFLFSYYATNTIIISYLPLYLKHKDLTSTEVGWVLAIGPLATILAQPFWGYLSDKYQTVKKILVICISGMLIASIIFFQMNALIAILLSAGVFYFFSTSIGALGDSLAQRRAFELKVSFGTIKTWGSVGFAISSLIIGAVLAKVGVQYMIIPYLIFGVFALVFAFKLKDVVVNTEPVQLSDVKQMFKNKPYVFFLIFIIFICVSHRANDSFVGLYIVELGGSESLVGLAWFVGVISEAIIFAFAGFWFRKYHPIVFVIIAAALYSVRWILVSSISSPYMVIALQSMHGLTFGVFYLASFDYIARMVPSSLQSTGHLIFFSVFFGVSGIIGSLMGGSLIGTYGGTTLYQVISVFAFIGMILLMLYHVVIFKTRQANI